MPDCARVLVSKLERERPQLDSGVEPNWRCTVWIGCMSSSFWIHILQMLPTV
ncbi:hypothetical protein A830093M07 [Mus musculus]|nr:hypothetical protein A830093M07 [Mus musculus]